jgi:hypothetical protein
MTLRHTIYTALAALHLVLVACGAAGWTVLPPNTAPGHSLRLVRTYTGSDANYGFFAPGVSSQLRATITLIDGTGKQWTDTLDAGMSREAQFRAAGSLGMAAELPGLQPVLAKSWAATMFGRHPTAKTVIVGFEAHGLPPMDDYQQGMRPEWILIFEQAFDRK